MFSRFSSSSLSLSSCISSYQSAIDYFTHEKLGISDPMKRDSIMGTFNGILISFSLLLSVIAALRTLNPISVVLSGSMIPTMNRGDILILTKRVGKEVEIEEVEFISSDDEEKEENITTTRTTANIAAVVAKGMKKTRKIFMKFGEIKCGDILVFDKSKTAVFNNPNLQHEDDEDEKKRRASRQKKNNGSSNRTTNEIVSGGIVHRVISLHIDENGEMFVLTKGDNNTMDDRVFYPAPTFLLPLNENTFVGKVIARVPYVGYLPLMLQEKVGLVGRISLLAISIAVVFYLDYYERKMTNSRVVVTSSSIVMGKGES